MTPYEIGRILRASGEDRKAAVREGAADAYAAAAALLEAGTSAEMVAQFCRDNEKELRAEAHAE